MVKKSLFRGKKAYATVSPVLEIATLKSIILLRAVVGTGAFAPINLKQGFAWTHPQKIN